MSERVRVSRRSSLQFLLAAVGLCLVRPAAAYDGATTPTDLDAFLEATLVRIAPSARAIGYHRLKALQMDGSSSTLRAWIAGRLRAEQRTGPAAEQDPELALTRAIRADFASGDVVSVDGWILSRTEASLCFLSISQPTVFLAEGRPAS